MERPRLKKPSTERCFFMSGFVVGMEKMEIVCVCVILSVFLELFCESSCKVFLGGSKF